MSKAEEQALKAYPNIKIGEQHIDQSPAREVYVQGYEQAEKDYMEKAEKWLKDNAHIFGYAECTDAFDAHYIYDADKLVESFKQAMSELK